MRKCWKEWIDGGNWAPRPSLHSMENPMVEMYARFISEPTIGIGKCNIIADKADISEAELLSGFVPDDVHKERRSVRFIMGLATGMAYPSEYRMPSDVIARQRTNKSTAVIQWGMRNR